MKRRGCGKGQEASGRGMGTGRLIVGALVGIVLSSLRPLALGALGQAYRETVEATTNPVFWQEVFDAGALLHREYRVEPWRRLVIHGEMAVHLLEEPEPVLRIRGNRALLGQLSVLSLGNTLFLSVHQNLLGPREQGRLQVHLGVVPVREIEVVDGVTLLGTWRSPESVALRVRSGSRADLEVDVDVLILYAGWNAEARLRGRARSMRVEARDRSEVDLTRLRVEELEISLTAEGRARVADPAVVRGRVARGSVLWVADPATWREKHAGLRLEGSLLAW